MASLVCESAWLTDVGSRTEGNEDFALADTDLGIFVVADGVGGRPGGACASREAALALVDDLAGQAPGSRCSEAALRRAVDAGNARVHRLAVADPAIGGMGTTLSAVVLDPADSSRAMLVHVGDSRIYHHRNGRLRRLTRDHTMTAELVERGALSPERAACHPMRNVLSRCIGPVLTVDPDIAEVGLAAGDWLVLATDGLTDALPNECVEQILTGGNSQAASADRVCGELLQAALSRGVDDNVTILIVRVYATSTVGGPSPTPVP